MNKTALSMDLKAHVVGFMAKKEKELCDELAEKYGVPLEEVAGVVESFLKDTYGPAIKQAWTIDRFYLQWRDKDDLYWRVYLPVNL